MNKQERRRQLKRARAQVPKPDRQKWDQAIAENLESWSLYNEAQKIMIYLAFGWEINTWPLVHNLKERGAEVYVPVVQKKPRGLAPTLYTAREDLVPAVFGILEPRPGTPTLRPEDLDLVVVPGLVFSNSGYRIGYGGGYYDRFLATTPAKTVGLVYSSFIQELIPDSWDRSVEFLVTEEGIMGRK